MIIKILPSHPYSLESAQALSGLLLDGAHDIPPQSSDVLAALMAFIVNGRPGDPQWSWLELHAALLAATDCGESEGWSVDTYLDTWFDLLHAPGLEVAANALDGTPMPRSTAGAVRSAIRVVALPIMRMMCDQMTA